MIILLFQMLDSQMVLFTNNYRFTGIFLRLNNVLSDKREFLTNLHMVNNDKLPSCT